MPDPRQSAEEGEVEDGELPPTPSNNTPASNGHSGAQYRNSGSLTTNGADKRPSIQIGLSKLPAGRSMQRPSLLEEDSASSSNRINSTAGLSIKGASLAGPSYGTTSSQTNTSGYALNIKGRSSGTNGDLHAEGDGSSAASTASPNVARNIAYAGQQVASPANQMSIKGANAIASGLPPKPRTSMALPFKMKGASSKLPGASPAPASYPQPIPQAASSNAIGKGYGNAMIVPKIPSVTEPGPSYTPPPRNSGHVQPKPPSPEGRPPSPPSEARPPSPRPPPPPAPLPPSSLPTRPLPAHEDRVAATKGKGREQQDVSDLEEGEEVAEEHMEPSSTGRRTPNSRSSPYRESRSIPSGRTAEKYRRDDDDDDRRRASFGRSQGDRWESSYRSPRPSRFYEREYETSSRRHHDRDEGRSSRRRHEDDYHRRSGYDSYDSDDRHSRRDRHSTDARREKGRDRRHTRESDRDRDRDYDSGRERERADHSHASRRHNQSGNRKGNVWRRGSSYSPDDERRRSPKREPDFHDEPGAPRHFDRELASTRKSLPSTPSLPAKPVASLPERPKAGRRDLPAVAPPLPQAATPFFLPTPAVAEAAKTVSPWEDDTETRVDMEIGEAPASGLPEKVEARTFTLFGASALSQYSLEEKLGEGTFGVVHKARRKDGSVSTMPPSESDRRFRKLEKRRARQGGKSNAVGNLGVSRVNDGDVVALKKIVMHNDMDGVPITALREIRILKTLDHPNVVPVVDMAYQSGDYSTLRRGAVYMVFPYMAHDLAGLLENKKIVRLDQSLLKLYARQLLLGTSYLHRNKILHRDMKAANLLISDDGVLQIADFGLARSVETQKEGKRREYTNCVVTRWYRPPELLLGLRAYGPPIDMWGVGCVIGEMFFRHPIFTGSSDLDQISRIVQMCGTIDDTSMPGWEQLPESNAIQVQRGARNVKREFSRFSDELADLLDKLLVYDPDVRLTADQALDHVWFWTDPLPAEVGSVRAFPSSHEYDKRKAAEERQGHGGEKARAAQEAAFKGPNHTIRPAAAPVRHQQPVPQPAQVLPVMQAEPWGGRPSTQRGAVQQPTGPPMMAMQVPRAGLPPRPVAPLGYVASQPAGYQNMVPTAGYPNAHMSMMGSHAANMPYPQPQAMSHSHATSMRPQERYSLPPSKEMAIAGRSAQGRERSDPVAKRPRLASPPGRLVGGIAGRSRIAEHADNLGGQAGAFRPSGARQNASTYDDNVPAGSAEPLD